MTIGFTPSWILRRVLKAVLDAIDLIPKCIDLVQQRRRKCWHDFKIAIPRVLNGKIDVAINQAFHIVIKRPLLFPERSEGMVWRAWFGL